MSFAALSNWQVYDPLGRRKYVSADELRSFLIAADRLAPDIRALCYVLAFTGCRISEALALTPNHFDVGGSGLVFRTLKRRKLIFRTVPIPREIMAMLRALPVGEDGRLWPIHRTTAWRRIKDAMTLARISGPMATPKGLRHGFGIRAAGKSVPPNLIQRWLGHANGLTTLIYMDAVGAEERGFAQRMW